MSTAEDILRLNVDAVHVSKRFSCGKGEAAEEPSCLGGLNNFLNFQRRADRSQNKAQMLRAAELPVPARSRRRRRRRKY